MACRTWHFFETFVGPDDHGLPADDHQETPQEETEHTTLPTNIGFGLLATLSAYDLGYLGRRSSPGASGPRWTPWRGDPHAKLLDEILTAQRCLRSLGAAIDRVVDENPSAYASEARDDQRSVLLRNGSMNGSTARILTVLTGYAPGMHEVHVPLGSPENDAHDRVTVAPSRAPQPSSDPLHERE